MTCRTEIKRDWCVIADNHISDFFQSPVSEGAPSLSIVQRGIRKTGFAINEIASNAGKIFRDMRMPFIGALRKIVMVK